MRTIYPTAKLVAPDVIEIGHHVIIDDFVFIVGGENTKIGNYVHIASFVSITGGGRLRLEGFNTISTGTKILTGTDNQTGPCLVGGVVLDKYRQVIRSYVTIQKHVHIGASTTILPGVTIGEGAVIGAGALVLKDCEPWTVYVGVPAKPIRVRSEKTILTVRTMAAEVEEEYALLCR